MTGILAGTIGAVFTDESGHVTATLEDPIQVGSLASALRVAGHHRMAQLAEAD